MPGRDQSLTRADLTHFFAQCRLHDAVGEQWELVVALVSRGFAGHGEGCAQVIEWLGDGADAVPETRLAQILVDLVKTPSLSRSEVSAAQQSLMRTRGEFASVPPTSSSPRPELEAAGILPCGMGVVSAAGGA